MELEQRMALALDIAEKYGCVDGAHHKQWVIDQMVRFLTWHGYEEWVAKAKAGKEGPDTYPWETGVAP